LDFRGLGFALSSFFLEEFQDKVGETSVFSLSERNKLGFESSLNLERDCAVFHFKPDSTLSDTHGASNTSIQLLLDNLDATK
jgi:hypothetical protein